MASSDIPAPPLPRRPSCCTHLHPPPHRRDSADTRTRCPHRRGTKAVGLATALESSTPAILCAAPHVAGQDGGPPRSVAAVALLSHVPPPLPSVLATVAPDGPQVGVWSLPM